VNGVDFSLAAGETVGLVGESGSGKSTIGRVMLRLTEPSDGTIIFHGRDITDISLRQFRPLRAHLQIVFQDPWSALNPRKTIGAQIAEPLLLHAKLGTAERRKRVVEVARLVRLSPELLDRYPSELSGGQLQRVCVARAIITDPEVVVLDEPTSSLDLSVRAGIISLLIDLRARTGMSMLFITHDLDTVKLVADRILVLYLGFVVESAATTELFERPEHPYTQALMSAHLPADPNHKLNRFVLQGEIPSPINLPAGCPFVSRCPIALPLCSEKRPELRKRPGSDRAVACHRVEDGTNWLPT
jgi:oligopeptide/dipeptide ABC transporter ATP-binding protein